MEPHATQSKSVDCSISEKKFEDATTNESTIANKGKNVREYFSHSDESTTVSSTAMIEEHMSKIMRISLSGTKVGCLKNKLIVLDINGLLADIVSPAQTDHKADAMIARRAVFKRPYYFEFLNFCFQNFEVGLWSSRKKENVQRIVHYLMGDMKKKLLFCWDVSHCTQTSFRTLENRYKDLVFKDLRKIWDKDDANLPWEKGYYNESNTLLLDDSPYKALLNPPHTSVFPHTFSYQNKIDNSLAPGGNLREYLEGLAKAESMSKYVVEHPFGQERIGETSESWNFYIQVIRSVLAP